MPKSVFVIPGFGEGAWHMKSFSRALVHAGFTLASSAATADVIVTHSGGIQAFPDGVEPHLVVMINPVYWPGKPLLLSFAQKIWSDFLAYRVRHRLGRFFIKSMFNLWYMLTRPRHTLSMLMGYLTQRFHKLLPPVHLAIIRNHNDHWCTPTIARQVPTIQTLRELPGEHDDCWDNPEPYVRLIQSFCNPEGKL